MNADEVIKRAQEIMAMEPQEGVSAIVDLCIDYADARVDRAIKVFTEGLTK